YPIANDPLYSKTEIWGEQCGKGGVNKEGMDKVIENMMAMGFPNLDSLDANKTPSPEKQEQQEPKKLTAQNPSSDTNTNTNTDTDTINTNNTNETTPEKKEKPSWYVESCDDCVHPKSDPKPHQMCIWLHAYSYASNSNSNSNNNNNNNNNNTDSIPDEQNQKSNENENKGDDSTLKEKEEKNSEKQKNFNSHITILDDAWSFKTSLPDWAKEDFVEN
ncbi:hypothetical protein PIROE2DRAFT_6668, partial [Piromyces sp. E2]